MPKRRTHDSFDASDNPIGLTGAFAPVRGPQSVDYDENDDPVGLTQAFGAIPDQDEPRVWDEEGKWKDFDWDSLPPETSRDEDTDALQSEDEDSADGDYAADEAQVADTSAASGTAARASRKGSSGPKHGRHAAVAPELSPRMKKSRRTRRVLIVLIILLVLAALAVGFFGYRTITGSQLEPSQQTQSQSQSSSWQDIASGSADDAVETTTKQADVPNLTNLLGMSQDEAIATIGRGAIVTQNNEVHEEGNAIKRNLNVALTEEPADSKTGTPTVYLGLASDGTVWQVGYSASASALGFGSLSFTDAISNEHVVEKMLGRVGLNVPEGTVTLPQNKDEYSSYGADGTTVVRERCSFEGASSVNGVDCIWSSVLSYDYTTQVVTGNLNDTVRIIYVYITKNVEPPADPEPAPAPAPEAEAAPAAA